MIHTVRTQTIIVHERLEEALKGKLSYFTENGSLVKSTLVNRIRDICRRPKGTPALNVRSSGPYEGKKG